MFDFGNANDGQRKAISTVDGPVLITAGPGTGKTYTLVQRAIYMIEECGVAPEQILMATFTEKAAKELITRITNEMAARNIAINVNEMYIGTFHSICLRIIKEHLEYTRLKKNYRTLDAFDQAYTVFQNIGRFKRIKNLSVVFNGGAWNIADDVCKYVNNLTEELVEPAALKADSNLKIKVIGDILETYQELLEENNLVDFASIQTEAYRLMKENPSVLEELHDKIKYIMIDEYQDTNYIQEQIAFLLAGESQNICVVGDDDQGLYRFRGATIRNILEFPDKFPEGACKVIPLVVNYRSNSDIVDFYNKWMTTTSGYKFGFSWDKFRYPKEIVPFRQSKLNSSAVMKLVGYDDQEEWFEKVLGFIRELMDTGKVTNYNQVAFLFNSVKGDKAVALAEYLEEHGINVYSPRSDMFFKRKEIQLTIGLMMMLFPNYVEGIANDEYAFLQEKHKEYFSNCIEYAREVLGAPENVALRGFIDKYAKIHAHLQDNTNYAYTSLLYQLFAYEPFGSILNIDMHAGVVDVRPARNLSLLSQVIGKYEYLHRIEVLSPKKIDEDTEKFFNLYLKLLYDGGINEYEDDSEYAPSGCVSFLTIHQSKGMEFPIVFVDSLANNPRTKNDDILNYIEGQYFKRAAYEPHDQTKYFDFWRLFYTAFSRAQDLLILTCNETSRTPSKYFKPVYRELEDVTSDDFDINEFTFAEVKDVNLKETFSFTSHISVYETCPRQYKFYKELGFTPVRQGAMMFGILVHETIEDVHRAAIRKEEHLITEENINKWFDTNYASISKSEHSYLAPKQREAALKQVLKYVDRQHGDWSPIQQAEVDVSLVKEKYIIEGKIDLIKGDGDTVEIIDFKSEKKPDVDKHPERLEQYKRQLHLYAHLVEERTGHKVSKMHLYYTGEEGNNPTITYTYEKAAIQDTMTAFDDTVQKIMDKKFTRGCNDRKVCNNCDLRYFCKR